VFLECGLEEKDESGFKRLETALSEVTEELGPAMVARDPGPLHKVVRVRRDDPAEAVLVRTLLRSEPDLLSYEEPMAFPVFGRGRALYALVGAGITRDNVWEAWVYIAGRCSCLVKEQNPGVDLLLAADWEDIERPLEVTPPLNVAEADGAVATSEAPPLPPMPPSLSPGRYILIALAGALLLVGVLSAVLLRKSLSPTSSR
jgi:hypothetical protein